MAPICPPKRPNGARYVHEPFAWQRERVGWAAWRVDFDRDARRHAESSLDTYAAACWRRRAEAYIAIRLRAETADGVLEASLARGAHRHSGRYRRPDRGLHGRRLKDWGAIRHFDEAVVPNRSSRWTAGGLLRSREVLARAQLSGSPTRARTWDLRINSPSRRNVSFINCLRRPRTFAIAVERSATQGYTKRR